VLLKSEASRPEPFLTDHRDRPSTKCPRAGAVTERALRTEPVSAPGCPVPTIAPSSTT